jgi:SAM-dependent methyltransferase
MDLGKSLAKDLGMKGLPPDAFRREDEAPDEVFYRAARLVTHIDAGAIAAVTQLYREYFPPGGALVDLMSSWISHLPREAAYERVAGLGMNAEELAANPRLTEWVVHDLNRDPRLPYGEAEFDGAGLCVSIDYLTQPVAVLREAGRVLKPGAPLVITFSNRCFPTKAVAIWLQLDDAGHVALVAQLLAQAGNWEAVTKLDRSLRGWGDPLFAVVGRAKGKAAQIAPTGGPNPPAPFP